MNAGGVFISTDIWSHVAGYLRARDLCACMQLSTPSLPLWVCDRIWRHQWERIVALCPEAELVRVLSPNDTAGGVDARVLKRRKAKKSSLMPNGGLWFSIRALAVKGWTLVTLDAWICKQPSLIPLMGAVARICSQCTKMVVSTEVANPNHDTFHRYEVTLQTKTGTWVSCRVYIDAAEVYPHYMEWSCLNGIVLTCFQSHIVPWIDFLCQRRPRKCNYYMRNSISQQHLEDWLKQ